MNTVRTPRPLLLKVFWGMDRNLQARSGGESYLPRNKMRPEPGLILWMVLTFSLGPPSGPRPPWPIVVVGGFAFGLGNEGCAAELDLAALLVDADALDHASLANWYPLTGS